MIFQAEIKHEYLQSCASKRLSLSLSSVIAIFEHYRDNHAYILDLASMDFAIDWNQALSVQNRKLWKKFDWFSLKRNVAEV